MNTNLLRAKVRFGVARACDFEALGDEEVRAIKSDNGEIQYRFDERAVKPVADNTYDYDASTEHRDSMGDRITVAGWDTKRIKIGVMPFFLGHRSDQIMGRVLSARKDWTQSGERTKSLVETVEIYGREIYGDSELGKTIEFHHTLVKNGLMPGVSVGFMPVRSQWPRDDEERTALDLGPWGMLFLEQEQLELSATPIPANRNANERKSLDGDTERVRSLVKAGSMSDEFANLWLREVAMSTDEWLERNVPNLSRKSFALPGWVAGAKNAKDAAEGSTCGPTCGDAKTALANTVREVVEQALAPIKSDIAAVLRSKKSNDTPANVTTSQADSTAERGTGAEKAQVADSARKPGKTSRVANPLQFFNALDASIKAGVGARATKNDRHRDAVGQSAGNREG